MHVVCIHAKAWLHLTTSSAHSKGYSSAKPRSLRIPRPVLHPLAGPGPGSPHNLAAPLAFPSALFPHQMPLLTDKCSFFNVLFIYLFLETGESKGEKHQCERVTSTGCLLYTPPLGIEPTTLACAPTGNQTGDLSLCRATPSQLSHAGQGPL